MNVTSDMYTKLFNELTDIMNDLCKNIKRKVIKEFTFWEFSDRIFL